MALPPEFLDELRARTPIAAVIGRRVRLVRSGRMSKGCCPFHGEKSPSFYVYDDHFHCFGCGEHGDVITFVMKSQGAGFTEAVEQLAGEAGLDVPQPSRAAAEAERRRLDLHGVMDAATRVFARRLWEPDGAAALAYLRGRGLTDGTIRGFDLGWSGEGRGALTAELARSDVSVEMLIEAGLLRPGEDGRPPFELFFNRVMFPIRDRRGRVISFGGRILGAGQPKYVNGPETSLFPKRRTLFGLHLARAAAHRGAAVVVVEGYMDVIVLHQAGFDGAVAPLGTALTDEQLAEVWRMSPMPVLCFDGDAAGARAAARAVEMALPAVSAAQTIRIATLPPGEDPDSLVRSGGAGAFQAVLDSSRPMVDALFDLAREATGEATPEQRAMLRTRLDAAVARIGDKALASEYRRALLDRFFARRAQLRKPGAARQTLTPPRPVPAREIAGAERARLLVAILLRHPDLLHDVEEAFCRVDLPPALARLRDAILAFSDAQVSVGATTLDSANLMNHLKAAGLAPEAAQALAVTPYPLAQSASPDAMPAEAEAGWWHIFGLMDRGGLDDEVAQAARALAERSDDAAQRRLITLCTVRNALRQGEHGTEVEV